MTTRRNWHVPHRAATLALAATASLATANMTAAQEARSRGSIADAKCAALTGYAIPANAMEIQSGAAVVDSATFMAAAPLAIGERGPTPAARITPATPAFCKVLGHIKPRDPQAPPIRFQINLPANWNGNSLQYGGGGFNGVLITGTALPPAHPFDRPSPLAQGYATYGTDSGHETKPGTPVQTFALNDEAFLNFAHLAYKRVRDTAVAVMARGYGRRPENLYFMGSSEGGREALTMAQRYPDDFDGIFARVPVINWTGLIHASMRSGLITMGDAWLKPEHTKLVHDAVLGACDTADGSKDNVVANAVACKKTFDVAKLKCAAGANPDTCLNDKQIAAVKTLHSPYRFSFAMANGLNDYPGWGVSGEAIPPSGPTGGWGAWWLGKSAPTQPSQPDNAIQWVYGSGGIRYVFARDPNLDVTKYKPEDHKKRVLEVSNLMDSTNPDLSRFKARGGKLIVLEYMADYAQSPYAGIRYFETVQKRMGTSNVASFARLYTAPGVDHVGSGAPANVEMLAVLADWVERGKAPGRLDVVEQKVEAGFATTRSLPLCEWPTWPKYKSGDATRAASFECAK